MENVCINKCAFATKLKMHEWFLDIYFKGILSCNRSKARDLVNKYFNKRFEKEDRNQTIWKYLAYTGEGATY